MKVLIYFLLSVSFLISQLSAQRYIHNVPEAMVSVVASEYGFIYSISHSGKLYRFDGQDYTVLQTGIKDASALSVKDNHLIIESSIGIWKWDDNEIVQQTSVGKCYSYINVGDKEYILSPTGMQEFKEGRYQLVNDWTEAINPTAKFYQWGDDYYLANKNSIFQFKSNQWKILARDTFVINDLAYYQGEIWAATDSGLRVMKSNGLKQVIIDALDSKTKIDYLTAIEDDLYMQGEGDLLKWNSKDYQVHKIDDKSSPSNIVKDSWGDLWYADEGNIIQHKIGSLDQSTPIISDIEISIDGRVELGKDIEIEEEGRDVKFSYQAVHLRSPQDVKYQSLLSPFDKKYQDATSDRSIVYSNLPSGTYTYRLRSTIDGINYNYSDVINISVKSKEELSSLWWILAGVCLALLFLALLANYRLQQYKERSSLLTSKLRTANELLTSQQKTMQLQMNPHFLFNALNSIQGLVSLNRNDEAKKYLKTFSRMMRSVLDFSTVDKIDLQSEINYLKDYISIEQMTRSNSFEFELNVDESLLEDDIKLPPMILQPFIENAIIHGVSSIKSGKIVIDIFDRETELHCIISDNGIGRKAAAQKQKSSHKSVAISLAKERLEKLSTKSQKGSIQYKDLEQGTQVEIHISL